MSENLILDGLEKTIGIPAQQGTAVILSTSQQKNVISWLIIKGVEKRTCEKSSLETLGKMYGISNYLRQVILNQKEENVKKFGKKVNYYSPPLDDDLGTNTEEKKLENDLYPIETKSLPPSIKDIENIIERILLRKQVNDFSESMNQNNKKILREVEQIIQDGVKTIIEKTVEQKIETKTESLKKIIEETIFQSYLNHKISNQETPEIETKKETPQPQPNSQFIPKIDPNYHFDPYSTKVIRSALHMNENLYVYGDTGCGKTTHLEQVCAVLNRGIIRVNPHDGITREMFLGGMKLINNETIFIEGALPIAMRNGFVFLVDEISFLPPNLTAILNPVGENGGKLYIPETSEWITPQPGFCIFATDNTGGKGDRTGNYTGTEVQNTATLDRFAFCLKMDYLPKEKECEMLIKRFPNQNKNEIEKLLTLAKDIRLAFSRGELSITLSTRKLIKFFDQRNNNFSIQETLSNTILSWLDEDDEALVKTVIDRLQILGV